MRAKRHYNVQTVMSRLSKLHPPGFIDPFEGKDPPTFMVGPSKKMNVRRNDKNLLNMALHGVENVESNLGRRVVRINRPINAKKNKGTKKGSQGNVRI